MTELLVWVKHIFAIANLANCIAWSGQHASE